MTEVGYDMYVSEYCAPDGWVCVWEKERNLDRKGNQTMTRRHSPQLTTARVEGERRMSYDIELLDPVTKKTIILPEKHQMQGGTYCVGGTDEAHLNVTCNYSKHFFAYLDKDKGIRGIYGKTAAETIPLLENAIAKLPDDKTNDYWEPTGGNAKAALCQLLALARMRPDGIWDGD